MSNELGHHAAFVNGTKIHYMRAGAAYWIAEEQPEELLRQLLAFFSDD